MIKKIFTLCVATIVLLTSVNLFNNKVYASETKSAILSNQQVYLNGEKVYTNGYNIDGFNYFKIADVGKLLNFDVVWNEKIQMIEVFYNKEFNGSRELNYIDPNKATETQKNKKAASNNSKIRLVDEYYFSGGYDKATLESYPISERKTYNIDGFNYFKLKEIVGYGKSEVVWDEKLQAVQINTKEMFKNTDKTNETKKEPTTKTEVTTRLESTPKEVLERDLDIWQDENYQLSDYEKEVLRLVNVERTKVGLNEVTIDIDLCKISRVKSREMATMNYFDHK